MNTSPSVYPGQAAQQGRVRSLAALARRRKLPLLVALTALVAVPATLVALWGPGWGLGARARPDVEIASLRASLSPGEGNPAIIRVAVKVRNNTDRGQLIDAWWFLAQPGDQQPWLRYSYQSGVQEDLFLEPKSAQELVWQEELAVPAAEYQLSSWVHSGSLGAQSHADGVFLERTLTLPSKGLPYFRHNAPSDLQIEGVGESTFKEFPTRAPMEVSLPVSLRNESDRDLVADVRWDLVYEDEPRPFGSAPALQGGVIANQEFPAGAETVVKFDGLISPRPGHYLLLVRVATVPGSEERVWDDAKLFTTRLTVLENTAGNGIARVGQPTGPVSIQRLAVRESPISAGSTLSVVAELASSAAAAEEVEAWWFLSSPGVNEPWLLHDFASTPVRTMIEPGAPAEIEISDLANVAPGYYELSVWVHVVSGGEDRPSDGAWWTSEIRVR